MGSSQADKAANHDRIVDIAATRIRRSGINGVGVAEIMQEAGLTHGGFYRHFKSRDELVGAAVERALAQGSARTMAAADDGGTRAFEAISRRLPPVMPTAPAPRGRVRRRRFSPKHLACRGSNPSGLPGRPSRAKYLELFAGLTPTSDAVADRRRAGLVLSALAWCPSPWRELSATSTSRMTSSRDCGGTQNL